MRNLRLLSIGLVGALVGLTLPGCSDGDSHRRPTPTTTPVATASSTRTATAAPSTTATPTASATAVATQTATPTASSPPTATPTATPADCAVGPVQTTIGVVCGTVAAVAGTTVDAYLGIPYAEDTGGDNRWNPPVPQAMLQETFQATHFGPICPQTVEAGEPVLPQSEDCLSVNVWAPSGTTPTANLPVMVFIYGGSFLGGASAVPIYDPAHLSASQDVVVVTLNYRVGALAFLAGVHDLPGNYGLRDQQLALAWVRDNIAAFGGDKTRVMLFGESAGAMSVGLHLLSMPSSAELFSAALMESNPFGLPYKNMEVATGIGTAFEKVAGCLAMDGTPSAESLACMRALPAATIVAKQEDMSLVEQGLLLGFNGLLLWAPVIDGTLVTREPPAAAAAGGLPKPTLLGTNRDEGIVFIVTALQELMLDAVTEQEYRSVLSLLFGPTKVDAILQDYPASSGDNTDVLSQVANDYLFFCSNRFVANAGGGPVYSYLFTQPSHFNVWPMIPQCAAPAVCHFAEVPYVFNTVATLGTSFTPAEQVVSNAMLAYWSGFSRPGNNPNTGGESRPTWPTFSGFTYLELATPIATVVDPPHNCGLWDSIGYANTGFGAFLPAP